MVRVVIVGASGRAWDERSESLMRQEVSWIIYRYLINAHVDQLSPPIIISGHCPIGREDWYCIDCQKWLDVGRQPEAFFQEWSGVIEHMNHTKVLVYNKGGVDTWAEILGNTYKLVVAPVPASPPYPQGFFIRNRIMVGLGDVVHTIEPTFDPNLHKSEKRLVLDDGRVIYRSGGYWTYKEALKAGKQGFLSVI